jgi:hypothetical protein
MDPQSKEDQLRHAAHSLGLKLERSPEKDSRHLTFGGYMLVHMERNAVAYGAAGHTGRGYTLTLKGVEAYLKRHEKRLKKRVGDGGFDPSSGLPRKSKTTESKGQI